jgi:endonuclease/exonuclease/phosphatase family metal-dependent hydrolase
MTAPSCPRGRYVTAALVLAALWGCSDTTAPTLPTHADLVRQASYWTPGDGAEPFKVFTQNTYLGGDTGPLFGGLDFDDIPAVVAATNAFWAQVQQNDTQGRAAAIVDEIEARRPHLVGLQEVVRFAVVDVTTDQVVGGADILASIQAEIAARGLPYEVAGIQENTSSALPLAVGATGITRALAFTDRVAVLRRTDVAVTGSAQGTYAATFTLGPVTLKRGWIRLDVDRGGAPIHFVTTHLETQALAPVQAGQAQELLGSVLAGLDGLTILSGDLNSDAAAGPGAPSWTPTYDALAAAGFTDAWEQDGHAAGYAGFTCCQDPDLRNGASILDQRIDFVLLRAADNPAASGLIPGSVRVDVVGEEQADRTAGTGLWPTDHAGLVAGMRLAMLAANDGT